MRIRSANVNKENKDHQQDYSKIVLKRREIRVGVRAKKMQDADKDQGVLTSQPYPTYQLRLTISSKPDLRPCLALLISPYGLKAWGVGRS